MKNNDEIWKMKWTEENKEKAIQIILKKIQEGRSLRSILKIENRPKELPNIATFLDWVNEDKSLNERYACARDVRTELKFESIEQDYLEEPQRDPETGRIDPAWVNLQRLKIDAKKWELSKLMPKKYGDKLDIDAKVSGDIIIQMPGEADGLGE